MAKRIRHRGPDGDGFWVDATEGVAFGHRRLAIVDLSPAGQQPMHSADGRYVLTYNGELYNHQELRVEMMQQGHQFRGHSDTEVMLELIAARGLDAALDRFDAMFAAALWDRRERRLYLFRDRFGEKPLYYAQIGGNLFFASELAALSILPSFPRDIDRDAVRDYLQFGCIPAPRTIFAACQKLQPATVAVCGQDRSFRQYSYWSAANVATSVAKDERPWQEQLRTVEALMARSVGGRMQADVPLGAFLSGGVDSTAVVAAMSSQSSQAIKTFTIGFDDADFDESPYAEQVARHLGTDHVTARLSSSDALNLVPDIANVYDEPFADSSQLPTLLISRMTRRAVTVALTGDGGDELFGGYNRHIVLPKIGRLVDYWPRPLRSSVARVLSWLAHPRHRRLLDSLLQLLPRRKRSPQLALKLHKLADALTQRDLRARYLRAVSLETTPEQWVPGTAPRSDDHLPSCDLAPAEWLMLADTLNYLPDDILVKVDRASMHVSLETRTPFLQHELYGAVAALPTNVKVRGNTGKWLLRQLVQRSVPAAMMDRPKAGFAVPIGAWLRGPLREWADDLLAADALEKSGLVITEKVHALWHAHRRGDAAHEHRLWSLLMLQSWYERHAC